MSKPKPGYLKQTFAAREYPEAIDIDGELVAGPFCVHCGNPYSTHGPDERCPNQHRHPLFPPPALPYREPLRCVLWEGHHGEHRFGGPERTWGRRRCAVDENHAKAAS